MNGVSIATGGVISAAASDAPTVAEIRAEMEGAGTKLSDVLTDTGTTLNDKIDRLLAVTEIRKFAIADTSATTKKFITDLTETDSTFWERAALLSLDGDNMGQIRAVHEYNGSTKRMIVKTGWNSAPANGDTFAIIPARKFLVPDIDEIFAKLDVHDQTMKGIFFSEG